MEVISFKEFMQLAERGNLIPLILKVNADTETPVSAFLKMTHGPYRFLFESLEGGEKWGRYSFLGSEPTQVIRANGNDIEIHHHRKVEKKQGDIFSLLREILGEHRPVQIENLPRFVGGMIGYLGYDSVRQIEEIPDLHKPNLPLDDAVFWLQDSVIIFDNLLHQLEIVVMAKVESKQKLRECYDNALEKLHVLAKRLQKPLPKLHSPAKRKSRPQSNMNQEQFQAMVEKAKDYIRAGDIFQVQLAQRWKADFLGSPFQVYRELRQINPSPYLFYLEMGSQVLLGSSPEVMVRVEGKKITTRPIAGTRRRGKNPEDELKMIQEVSHDPKELAEHVMLVDLARNDLGRVSTTGSVRVTEMMSIEKYSHVMHLVSNVEGELKEGLDAIDVLKATFPAGTLTGAPKIRAMEIIEELEPERRNFYGGAVGYIDFYGNLDTAITIRSIAFARGKAWVQSAGGIVLDSVPELEYLESNNKSKAVLEALKRCS